MPIRAFDGEAHPVYFLRPCAYVPELRKILASAVKGSENGTGRAAGRMAVLHRAKQNVRVDQNAHLPAVRVQVGAADGLIGERQCVRKAVYP